jgi:hypothetical protein
MMRLNRERSVELLECVRGDVKRDARWPRWRSATLSARRETTNGGGGLRLPRINTRGSVAGYEAER